MDTLDLVLANDSILDGATILDDEDGILVTTLSLASAGNATSIGLDLQSARSFNGLGA